MMSNIHICKKSLTVFKHELHGHQMISVYQWRTSVGKSVINSASSILLPKFSFHDVILPIWQVYYLFDISKNWIGVLVKVSFYIQNLHTDIWWVFPDHCINPVTFKNSLTDITLHIITIMNSPICIFM